MTCVAPQLMLQPALEVRRAPLPPPGRGRPARLLDVIENRSGKVYAGIGVGERQSPVPLATGKEIGMRPGSIRLARVPRIAASLSVAALAAAGGVIGAPLG